VTVGARRWKMCNQRPRIELALAAGMLLRFLVAPFACGGSPPNLNADGRAQPAPSGQPPAENDARQSIAVVFKDVKVFDGKSAKRTERTTVLVVGNRIERIGGAIAVPGNATVIEGGGRTLMPGLIDAHWHAMLVRPTPTEALTWDIGYANLVAGSEAADTLMRGFTTVRDMGGSVFGLKRAIDEGVVVGPRIYPSGAMITTTGGHGDFRQPFELPRTLGSALTRMEQIGGSMLADSPDEVRLRVREQLMLGATQIKLTAGGGVASPHSPLDVTTFTEPELRAAVEAAENWGTYVTVHAYTPASIKRAIDAGVKWHRARPLDGRSDRPVDGEARRLVEHSAFPGFNGRCVSARFGTTVEIFRGVGGYGDRVPVGTKAQAQNSLGYGYPLLFGAGASPG